MISVQERLTPPVDKNTVRSLNRTSAPPVDSRSVQKLNRPAAVAAGPPVQSAQTSPGSRPQSARPASMSGLSPATVYRDMVLPKLYTVLRPGQKTSLGDRRSFRVCVGWNVSDTRCDIDVSAFLLREDLRVPGDSWFVFYGNPESPDKALRFYNDPVGADREIIEVNLDRLGPDISRIVFVLTINEAFSKRLNFSMVKDAYIRILERVGEREILSFRLTEFYETVTSMTIGELYRRNGQWKFNPVGNGVHQDLAGQCSIYGVHTG